MRKYGSSWTKEDGPGSGLLAHMICMAVYGMKWEREKEGSMCVELGKVDKRDF